MTNEPKLGKLAGPSDCRDAIHVAIAPVVAGEPLEPGQHVGILADGTASRRAKAIGIVDPFLTEQVKPGQRFFICLYPGTITSLRHVWSHPAFKAKIPEVQQ